MKKNLSRDLTVGVVVLLAAFIFTIGIFSIGSEQRIWVKKVNYKIRVPEANGLQSGSPVKLAGVQVGTVTSVSFSSDPTITTIEVGLSVDQSHQGRIRQDTVASVNILTLLGGEKYIELTPGSPGSEVLPPGSYIQVPETFGMDQLGELSASLADDLQSISSNVRIILDTIQSQQGLVGKMLLDPNFGQQAFSDLGESARLTRQTLEKINSGEGVVGKFLADQQFARETTESIKTSLDRIEQLLAQATQPGGVVQNAMDPNGQMAAALDNVYQATADLQDFTAELKEGQGILGRLVSDEQYADEVLANIKKISEDLSAITSKINQGEGSLGGLVNDPQLYDDMTDVIRGVKESKMISWLIRHYRKKGEKVRRKEEEQLMRDDVEGIDPTAGGG